MKKFLIYLCIVSLLIPPSVLAEDRSIILVTSKGVYQADVINGIPGAFVAKNYDVIVQGVSAPNPIPDPTPDPDPIPDPSDPVVQQISTMSTITLKDKNEATAVAALVDTLAKLNLSGESFKNAMNAASGILDSQIGAQGRINMWVQKGLVVSLDPVKLRAGVVHAFGISQTTLNAINMSATGQAAITGEALDWEQLIFIITEIIKLLKLLNII